MTPRTMKTYATQAAFSSFTPLWSLFIPNQHLLRDAVVCRRGSAEGILKPSLLQVSHCNYTGVVFRKEGIKQNIFFEQICRVLNVVPVSHRQTFSVRSPHLFWRLRHMKLGTVWTLFHPLWTFELLLGHIKHPLLGDSSHSENQE